MPCYCYCNDPAVVLAQQQLHQQGQLNQQQEARRAARRRDRSPGSIASTSSWRSRFSLTSRRTELPPAYGESTGAQEIRKTVLPHAVPLRASPDDASRLDALAKVYAVDLGDYDINKDQFTHFIYNLTKRMTPAQSPGMLGNLNVLRGDDRMTPGAAITVADVQTFVTLSNLELFNPAGLYVEVVGTEAIMHGVASSPALDVHRSMTTAKLFKLEEQLSKLSYTLDRELSGVESDDALEKEEMQSAFEVKRTKLRAKAQQALADFSTKSPSYSSANTPGPSGPLSLIVSQKLS